MLSSLNYDELQSLMIILILANSADPDQMLYNAAFLLVFTFCKNTCLRVSRIQTVKITDHNHRLRQRKIENIFLPVSFKI